MNPDHPPPEGVLLPKLQSAIHLGHLQAHFQPEFDLSRPDWIGFEALSRWQDPEWGIVSPAVFIPLAEKHGLLAQLTCLQVLHLTQSASSLCQRFGQISLGLNVSPRLIGHPDLWATLLKSLQDTSHLPLTWDIEITESEPIEDFEQAEIALSVLRQHGFRVVLDDFGTGWSNLVRLALLGIQRIKVDSVFVRNLHRPATQTVMRGMLELAKAMQLEITIEGVETLDQQSALQQMGFERFQGWLYAPALPLGELLTLDMAPLKSRLSSPP